jgi:hypothetical protein
MLRQKPLGANSGHRCGAARLTAETQRQSSLDLPQHVPVQFDGRPAPQQHIEHAMFLRLTVGPLPPSAQPLRQSDSG